MKEWNYLNRKPVTNVQSRDFLSFIFKNILFSLFHFRRSYERHGLKNINQLNYPCIIGENMWVLPPLSLVCLPCLLWACTCVHMCSWHSARPRLNHLSDMLHECVVLRSLIEGLLTYENYFNLSFVLWPTVLFHLVAFYEGTYTHTPHTHTFSKIPQNA